VRRRRSRSWPETYGTDRRQYGFDVAVEPPSLSVRIAYAGDSATVTLAGEIDLLSSTALNRELNDLWDRVPPPARVLVELADVGFMDTSGVAALLTARRRAADVGCRLVVTSTSPVIARLFAITGLQSILGDR
jgi:anti-sigma B factor antagonist